MVAGRDRLFESPGFLDVVGGLGSGTDAVWATVRDIALVLMVFKGELPIR